MHYLAEFYLPSHDVNLASLAKQARTAAEQASRAGPPVRFINAIHAPKDESCFAIYEADTPTAVTTAGALAGLTFDHIVEVTTQPTHDGAMNTSFNGATPDEQKDTSDRRDERSGPERRPGAELR
jgi:uncharacterized protein DUF4242